MYIEIENIEDIEKETGIIYKKRGELIDCEEINTMFQDLVYEIHKLKEKIEDIENQEEQIEDIERGNYF